MRTRRKQIAEEKAAKTAVKLIFPLVLFIFPGIFVVLVGPAAIVMVREMFPGTVGRPRQDNARRPAWRRVKRAVAFWARDAPDQAERQLRRSRGTPRAESPSCFSAA
jgi:hypothetical protein